MDYNLVFERIDENELADLATSLADIYGPVGHEEEAGEAVYTWLKGAGIDVRRQPVAGSRFNVIGLLKGGGGGPSLALNSHLDTIPRLLGEAQAGQPDVDAYRARREGNKLFGLATLNDRGQMAAWMIAAKALKDAGVRMKGDVVLTAVVGEIGGAPVDEYQGFRYLGKGIGTRTAISYGPHVDYALVAETTNFAVCWVETGVMYVKISVAGENIYSPRLRATMDQGRENHPNAIVKIAAVIDAIAAWCDRYKEEHALQTPCGLVKPKVNIGAIRGGLPYLTSETASSSSLYLAVWLPPGMKKKMALDELNQVLASTGIPAQVEVYMHRNGFVAGDDIEPLAGAVKDAYRFFTGQETPPVHEDVLSMWRDTNIYNEMGIPSLTFGPVRHKDAGTNKKYLRTEELTLAAKIYARTAMDICGVLD